MFNRSYLELLESLVEWDLNLLCPWKTGLERIKVTKMFRTLCISPLTLVLIMTSFVFYEWESLSMVNVAENIATAITMARSFGYIMLVKKLFYEYKLLLGKLFDDRKLIPLKPKEQSMTESYCKVEFTLDLVYQLTIYCIAFLLFHALVYLVPNEYELPFNCYIIFLHPDEFLFAWELNYLIITLATSFTAFSLTSYVPLPFLLMNHSCWHLDMSLMTADSLNEVLMLDEDIRNGEHAGEINENLKKFVDRCEKFVEWQSEVQELLFWSINLEFQVQALILCLSIYVISFTLSNVVLVLMFLFCVIQLFVLCWMGTRVTSRIDKLSFEISKNWYLMAPSQRKALQMILHWTQNMRGFSGMFKDVSLETCKAIFEASYTFYTFLRSTNDH